MKHLDQLLDELQEPIAQLMDWCDADKDRAVVACLKDLARSKNFMLFEAISEAFNVDGAYAIAVEATDVLDTIELYEDRNQLPEIDYEALYQPLEYIINDRIDLYNRS